MAKALYSYKQSREDLLRILEAKQDDIKYVRFMHEIKDGKRTLDVVAYRLHPKIRKAFIDCLKTLK